MTKNEIEMLIECVRIRNFVNFYRIIQTSLDCVRSIKRAEIIISLKSNILHILFILYRYIDGCSEITKLFEDEQEFIEDNRANVVKQILRALNYMHQ